MLPAAGQHGGRVEARRGGGVVAQSTAFNAHRATASRLRGRLAPQALKAPWRELGVTHRRLDASMTKVRLQSRVRCPYSLTQSPPHDAACADVL